MCSYCNTGMYFSHCNDDSYHFRLWRASRYVGCGDAVKINDGEKPCHIHVCRYVRAGNCNMGSYNASVGDNWLVPMLIGKCLQRGEVFISFPRGRPYHLPSLFLQRECRAHPMWPRLPSWWMFLSLVYCHLK